MEILIFIMAAYALMCFWTIWHDMRKPFLMPFGLYRYICSFGYKAPIENLPPEMDGLNKFAFSDNDFQNWFVDVNNRGDVSRLEFFAFNQQRSTELDAELARRGIK
jgi:hypothetical protein